MTCTMAVATVPSGDVWSIHISLGTQSNMNLPLVKLEHIPGFHTGFSVWGGGDVVCGLTGMGEYFSQVTPRNGAKSIVVSFC